VETTEHLLFVAALIMFLVAAFTRKRSHAYVGATTLLLALLSATAQPPPPATEVARHERALEQRSIYRAHDLDKEAHAILRLTPHTKGGSLRAQARATRFFAAEQAWLTRAEEGKPLKDYVDTNASTAAIRIVAADAYLTGAVQAAVGLCNPKDADANMVRADKIIADADAALHGHGDPHVQAPDLTNQLTGTNNCTDDTL
jgi:hypothetical protein